MQEQVSYAKTLVNLACAYAGISVSELARRMGLTQSSMVRRIHSGKLTYEEWQRLAEALGAELKISINFPDGKIIE